MAAFKVYERREGQESFVCIRGVKCLYVLTTAEVLSAVTSCPTILHKAVRRGKWLRRLGQQDRSMAALLAKRLKREGGTS